MKRVWILVADSYRARLFCAPSRKQLTEIGDLVHRAGREHSHDLVTNLPGRAFDSMGFHRHAMEQKLTPQEHEVLTFVHEIGQLLQQKLEWFDGLHLIAPPKLLGHLRHKLPPAVREKVESETAKDITDEPISSHKQRVIITM